MRPPDTVAGSAQRRTNSFPKECQRRLSSEDGHIKITKRYLLYLYVNDNPRQWFVLKMCG